jgi:hypothetical protein
MRGITNMQADAETEYSPRARSTDHKNKDE